MLQKILPSYLDSDSLDNWGAVYETVTGINHFLERLERKDNDWKKMPRSRDFPFNGIEFLKMWKASIIDKVTEQVCSVTVLFEEED